MISNLCGTMLAEAELFTNFCATELPVSVSGARTVLSLGASDMLVLERGSYQVSWLKDTDQDGLADSIEELVVLDNDDHLTHGLAIEEGYLYASSSSAVYRWPVDLEDLSASQGQTPQVVISNMNADGNGGAPLGHRTRTLAFDSHGLLYVTIGSNDNIDLDSFRARIRRFNISDSTTFPLDFSTGQVFAEGLRNVVGLAFDKFGVLWGMENGADDLNRTDLGGDIHDNNPSEELNRFPEAQAGLTWGYPYCWSEYQLPENYSNGTNSIWAWPDFMNDGIHTDQWCRANTQPSELSMQAHSAPLGITFYQYNPNPVPSCAGSFPAWMDGYAFIAFHGSWNREPPTGYKVVFVQMNANGQIPTNVNSPNDLLKHQGSNAQWQDGFRPVDVAFDACGRLLVTSDGTEGQGSKLVLIAYTADPTTNVMPDLTLTTTNSISSKQFLLFNSWVLLVVTTFFLCART